MKPLRFKLYSAKCCICRCRLKTRQSKRIVTDSQRYSKAANGVFFALAGQRFDAHDFVADVLAKGALAAVVSREDCAALPRALSVADALQALQTLAQAWRENVNPFVFGITRLFGQNHGERNARRQGVAQRFGENGGAGAAQAISTTTSACRFTY